MNRAILTACVLPFLIAMGCGDETSGNTPTPTGGKGVVDVAALVRGIIVTLSPDSTLGEVVVPFSKAVPAVADDTFESAMANAVTLIVKGPDRTANLADGVSVDDTPNGVGEFNWSLNGTRTEATFTFYNLAPAVEDGSLRVLRRTAFLYTATLTIASNPYVADVPATSFSVAVQ